MKRIFCLILALAVLVLLPACDDSGEEAVSFYYLRREFTMGQSDSVLASEPREFSGSRDTLDYLLGIYLNGPMDDNLISPFPEGTKLVQHRMEGDTLVLELSKEFSSLEGIRLTLAASCLATTCFHLTQAETVQITCGEDMPITLGRESLNLLDNSTPIPTASPAQ